MPAEEYLGAGPPFSGGAFQGNWAQTQDLYTWQSAETADNAYSQARYDPYSSQQNFDTTSQPGGHGQGQYVEPYGRLTQAERNRHGERSAIWDNGFDYGVHD